MIVENAVGSSAGVGAAAATGVALTPLTFGISAALVGLQAAFAWFKSNAAKNVYEDNVVAKLNAVEQQIQQTLQTYLNNPATDETQRAALAVIDAGIAWLMGPEFAGNQNLRDDWREGGVIDRSRGGQYDWYAMYRDPIANDPRPKQQWISQGVGEIAQSLGMSQGALMGLAGLAGLAVYLAVKRG